MRKIILLSFALGAGVATYATEASAVMCAKGVYNAACVGPRGAIAGHRGGAYATGSTVIRRNTMVHPRTGTVVRRGTTIRHY